MAVIPKQRDRRPMSIRFDKSVKDGLEVLSFLTGCSINWIVNDAARRAIRDWELENNQTIEGAAKECIDSMANSMAN